MLRLILKKIMIILGPNTVNNALFVGSTAELAKMLKSANLEDNK